MFKHFTWMSDSKSNQCPLFNIDYNFYWIHILKTNTADAPKLDFKKKKEEEEMKKEL